MLYSRFFVLNVCFKSLRNCTQNISKHKLLFLIYTICRLFYSATILEEVYPSESTKSLIGAQKITINTESFTVGLKIGGLDSRL